MRTLFAKLFLAFCATIIAGALLSFFIMGWLFPKHVWTEAWRSAARQNLRMAGVVGVRIYETEGRRALRRYVRRLEGEGPARYYFLDAGGRELTGRPVPREVLKQRRVPKPDRPVRRLLPPPPYQILRLAGPSGSAYSLIRHAPPPPRMTPRPSPFLITLASLLAVGMVLCFFLARHLTAPLRILQGTARDLASGHLSARVGAGLKERKDEFGALARDFDHMAERLQELLEAQRRLLRDVSHELRSPLTRLGVALELAKDKAPEEIHALLERIGKESERLNRLIGQVLTLARLEQLREPETAEELDLDGLVHGVVQDAAFEATKRDCTVALVRSEPVRVRGSAELLQSAVDNVVRNALRHAPAGTAVEVSLGVDTAGAVPMGVIAVRDRGPGVPEEAIGRLFHPFYRVDSSRDRRSGGVGLGLAIAHRAVRLHGGTLRAANVSDGGLRVEIRVPVLCGERSAASGDE
ncbi:two-component system, OmpR family, sensor histidine kinase CpxA [Desulfacinum hydrothermale DSM 13146]|uniref:histidine kinase n=1 Tax=Desulfacinum hydrothermale DSM 13146 TaxID=1121390 RepID=A0A1W1XCY5_9BACT|nr:ATP-binding protein [Desulfacinum hydrothermale]SMC21895.1 two-component system, OmpR family, sensor histidine kinase CpxA [Desulfacinum hydrothermale DSM 13146]